MWYAGQFHAYNVEFKRVIFEHMLMCFGPDFLHLFITSVTYRETKKLNGNPFFGTAIIISAACYAKNFGPKGVGYGQGAGALVHAQ